MRSVFSIGFGLVVVGAAIGAVLLTGWPEGARTGLDRNSTQSPAVAMPGGWSAVDQPTVPDRPDPIDLTEENRAVRGKVVPTVIDTRTFRPQIRNAEPWQGEIKHSSIFRPKKTGLPEVPPGPANNLVPGGVAEMARVSQQQFFPGIAQSPWNPPDPAIAVGPNHVIQTVNMELAFFDKDGTQTFQQRLDSSGAP